MFRIAMQTRAMKECYGLDGAYRVIAEAGFDAVDASIYRLLPYDNIRGRRLTPAFQGNDLECLEFFRPWKKSAAKYGLDNYQAHAPYPTHLAGEDDGFNETLIGVLIRCVMGCDFMNCRQPVVHPIKQVYAQPMTEEEEWERNMRRYSQLIPAAREYA